MLIFYPKLLKVFCEVLAFLCGRYMIFKRWNKNKFGLNTCCTSRKPHIGILIGFLQTVKFRSYLSQNVWLSNRCAMTLKFPLLWNKALWISSTQRVGKTGPWWLIHTLLNGRCSVNTGVVKDNYFKNMNYEWKTGA